MAQETSTYLTVIVFRITKYDSNLNYVSHFGSYGTGNNQWRYNYGFDIYNDEIYIADFYG